MLNLENIQDFCASNEDVYCKFNKPDLEPWIDQLLSKYNINDTDKLNLSYLIKNFEHWMKNQRKDINNDDKINLIRDMSLAELIYHYIYTLEIRKVIDVRVIPTPIGLIYHHEAHDAQTVTAKTHKSDNGVDDLFNYLQTHLSEELTKSLNEPEVVKIENLREYLESQLNFNKVYYNSTIVMESFKPMASNAIVIRNFKNFNKEVIEVKGCINYDEVLLKKQTSIMDMGFVFAPYLMPMRVGQVVPENNDINLKSAIMARFGIWVAPNINDYYKRIKVEL